jgi:oxalate decarboxylase
MVEMQRRDILVAGMGIAATAGLAAATPAAAGDPTFMNNVPDGLLSGDQLPTFKFALEKSAGKVVGGSYGKEATVAQLPISKGLSSNATSATLRRARATRSRTWASGPRAC